MKRVLVFLIITVLGINKISAQCVIINEVMVNGPGACDGGCNPNTEEWTELYNTCNTAVDLSCYVMTDGDFTVTFPVGTSIAANGYFVIGSNNSGGPVDINIATCGCAAGGSIGTFTNGNEQIILVNSLGAIQDAIYWGSGQFPVNITSATLGACSPITINQPNNTGFESVPASNSNGCTVARQCDASSVWVLKCGAAISMGSTNGLPALPNFTASDTTLCPTNCINFTDNSTGNPTAWSWTFSGAAVGTSSSQNPTNICYNSAGNYDVTLQITNACGNFTTTNTGYIQVTSTIVPAVTANNPLNFCIGDSVTLSTSLSGTYQWLLNGSPIVGETNATITVNQSGNYAVEVTAGNCAGTSLATLVAVNPLPIASINALSSTSICAGQSVILESATTATNYQWQRNGIDIPGAVGQQYTATSAGSYTLVLNDAIGCSATSTQIVVSVIPLPVPDFMASNVSICPSSCINFTDNSTGNPTAWLWTFQGAVTGSSNAQNPTNFCYNNSGSYDVTLQITNGCGTFDTTFISYIQVTPSVAPTITANGSLNFCIGDSVTLNTALGGNYQWLLNGNPIVGETNASIVITQSGNYSVQVTNGSCTGTSVATSVSVNPLPTATINALSSTSICAGQSVVLESAATATSYQWQLNGTAITGAINQQYTASIAGAYSLIVTNGAGCAAVSTPTLVTILPPAVVTVNSNTGSFNFCQGQSILLTATSGLTNYQWYLNSTAISGANTASLVVTQGGNYSFGAIGSNSCPTSSGNTIVSSIAPPLVDAGIDMISDCVSGVMLLANGQGNPSWIPSFGLSQDNIFQPMANPSINTTYYLTVDNGTCKASDSVNVTVDCFTIFIPNTFTPNHDGLNDVFTISGKGFQHFRLTIYNRWGEQLFESEDVNRGWDGTYNGEMVAEGVYVYIIEANDSGGNSLLSKDQQRGFVMLLR